MQGGGHGGISTSKRRTTLIYYQMGQQSQLSSAGEPPLDRIPRKNRRHRPNRQRADRQRLRFARDFPPLSPPRRIGNRPWCNVGGSRSIGPDTPGLWESTDGEPDCVTVTAPSGGPRRRPRVGRGSGDCPPRAGRRLGPLFDTRSGPR